MTDEDLTPQTPGDVPSIDNAKLDAILAMSAKSIPAELDALDDAELAQLRVLEVAGKNRAGVLKAIDTLIGSREADANLGDTEIQGATNANLGDRERYATMRASEVDASKIPVPVLTLDGWVLPLPRAEG